MKLHLFLKKEISKQFRRFVLIGLDCAALYYLMFIIFYNFLNIHYLLSTTLAFIISTSFGFGFNKVYTFSSKLKNIISFPRYILIYSFTLIFTLIFLELLVELFKMPPITAMLILIPITTLINFFATKIVAFRNFKWD